MVTGRTREVRGERAEISTRVREGAAKIGGLTQESCLSRLDHRVLRPGDQRALASGREALACSVQIGNSVAVYSSETEGQVACVEPEVTSGCRGACTVWLRAP